VNSKPDPIPVTMQRPDRRRARTRKAFFDALIVLILERGYDAIPIQDIADRADLSRATFYLHFADKHDLLMRGLHDIYDALAAALPPITLADLLPDGNPPCLVAFQQAAEYRPIYRLILGSSAGATIDKRIQAYLAMRTREQLVAYAQQAGITTFTLPIELLVDHMAASLMALINWWLTDAESPYSVQDMARIYHKMNCHAWLEVLGIKPTGSELTSR